MDATLNLTVRSEIVIRVAISLFPIPLAARAQREPVARCPDNVVQEVEARFVVFPISGRVCFRGFGLPSTYPGDPADRIIGATALVEGIPLLTADRGIRRSKALQTIW
jgi:PIN domain nuclease of toxin-antitoxin system